MVHDVGGLEIAGRVVQLGVVFHHVVLPDLVVDGIVLAVGERFLQTVGVLIGQREVQGRAVLDGAQDHFVDVALHVDGGTGEDLGAMENHAHERNTFAGLYEPAGVESHFHDGIRVGQCERVAAGDHDALIIGIELL